MRKSFIAFLCVIITEKVRAQEPVVSRTVADSVVFHLRKVGNASDTLQLRIATEWLYLNKGENLFQNDILTREIGRLDKILTGDQIAALKYDIIASHIEANSPALAYSIILYAKQYVDKYESQHTGNQYQLMMLALRELRRTFRNSNRIYEGIEYFNQMNQKFHAKNDSDGISITYNVLAGFNNRIGLVEKGKYYQLKSVDYLDDGEAYGLIGSLLGKPGKVNRYGVLANYLFDANKIAEAEAYLQKAIQIYNELDTPMLVLDAPFVFLQLARCKSYLNNDSSSYYFDQAFHYFRRYNSPPIEMANFYQEKAADCIRSNLDSARFYIEKSKRIKDSFNLEVSSYMGDLIPNYYLAQVELAENNPGAAIKLLNTELLVLKSISLRTGIIRELKLLATAYTSSGNYQAAAKTMAELLAIKEALIAEEADARTLSFDLEKKMQQDEVRIASLESTNASNRKAKIYLYAVISLLVLFALTLGRSIFNKQRLNKKLGSKNLELSHTLDQLQKTQGQLVQSEKMASLGELTAGIAHEIQNPLNFVNNFSEVNTELLDELDEQIAIGNMQQAKELSKHLRENEEKINHHGKRADAIVKSMLQHSRTSSSKKEPVDINLLADEYLRLSYHGLRAKDSSFQAKFETLFDPKAAKITIMPQEIGRVLLNLLNNAFYAANEKSKLGIEGFQPLVKLTTKMEKDRILISVADNGNGISRVFRDKIFQPFFTTKPTGQGTGLGLSLSYDIVKAHGGELRVETKEGVGSEFIIQLPIQAQV